MNLKFLDACQNGKINIVKELLTKVDPSIIDNFAIRFSAQNGQRDIVEFLLRDTRVDPSAWDNFAIRVAAENGHRDVVELLLKDSRVDPSERDNEAIRLAAENGHNDVVELLEQHNYKIDSICYNKMQKLK